MSALGILRDASQRVYFRTLMTGGAGRLGRRGELLSPYGEGEVFRGKSPLFGAVEA